MVETRSHDYERYASEYGLKFVPVNEDSYDDYEDLLTLFVPDSVITEVRQHLPDRFLSANLTADQRKLIDANETLNVAAEANKIQQGAARIAINEGFEPMVRIESVLKVPASFSAEPFHEACGEWGGKNRVFWGREQFVDRLAKMSETLWTGLKISVHYQDAFRPEGVQEGLFKRRVQWTMDAHPDWSMEQVLAEARSKTATTPRLSSHKGGAAVDVRLRYSIDGPLLDIGHDYPDGGAIVNLASPFVTQHQWQNRHLLLAAAKVAELTVYPGEDWHICYGDNLSTHLNGGSETKYGPVRTFDTVTGQITGTYANDELDKVFEI